MEEKTSVTNHLQVLEHGLRRSPLLLGPCHPWLFVEEAVRTEVERDFRSVYSRLVLCKTFRLNEDGKVSLQVKRGRYFLDFALPSFLHP